MSKLIDFPQRLHQEFTHLVREAVASAAKQHLLSIEDYIHNIYYRDESPFVFANVENLENLYQKYEALVESTIESVKEAKEMNKANKTYLCYRVYLHGMTIEREVMSEADSKEFLVKALKEFFYSRGKKLSIKDEVKIINTLLLATEQASSLGS